MVNFSAKLSLKDNMYASLQKNLKMQKEFSKQVETTRKNVQNLGKAKANPVVQLTDKATQKAEAVTKKIKDLGKTVASPFIQVKDTATKTITKVKNGLKAVGKTVTKPFVTLKDRASPILGKIKSTLKGVGSTVAKPFVSLKDGASAGLSKIQDLLKGIKTASTIGIVTSATALLGGAVSQGAKLEQSTGGIETLYKGKVGDGGAVDTVIANANMAYKTAGLSANAYMETVTSFSASLLQSLGGDTAKAASLADTAIIDMADNANKFGTDIESIQNAYQGFAKQNYTMLDNLKLGYGGTQEEMERLLSDAQKISGVKYDIKNLSDVYSAIHVVQENLGVTGTTAKEASQTFSGSFAAMKSSLTNMLGAMATGGDIEGTMTQLVESASTFLFNNAIPMVGRVLKALPTALKTGISNILPELKANGGEIVESLKSGIMEMLPESVQTMFGSLSTIIPTVQTIFSGLGDKVGAVVGVIQSHMGLFQTIFNTAIPAVKEVLTTAWNVISPIIDFAITVFDELLSCVETAFPTIQSVIEGVWGVLKGIFEGIAGGISAVSDAISGIGEFIGSGISAIGSVFGFAYGKDRVPYDNYPAVLHQGEKVLTRNQADQYDRQVSTRGVKLTENTLAVRDTTSKQSGGTDLPQEIKQANAKTTTVKIEKLADTVVIEKEADVDKVVEGMIDKFTKLVPNMP